MQKTRENVKGWKRLVFEQNKQMLTVVYQIISHGWQNQDITYFLLTTNLENFFVVVIEPSWRLKLALKPYVQSAAEYSEFVYADGPLAQLQLATYYWERRRKFGAVLEVFGHAYPVSHHRSIR